MNTVLKVLPGCKIVLAFLLLVCCRLYAQHTDANELCFQKLNLARKEAGLKPVKLSAALSIACGKHAKYLLVNRGHEKTAGLLAHQEFEDLPGYSPEGADAGKRSVIHFVKPTQAIDDWLAAFYHRIPLLQPDLNEIGIGYATDGTYEVSVLICVDKGGAKPKIPIVYYPAPGQKNVPVKMKA